MADEIPTGDKAVFAFLEMVALAFAFEGVSALLNGGRWPIYTGSLICAGVFFVAGIKWPKLKATVFASRVAHLAHKPPMWFFAGALSAVALYAFMVGLHFPGPQTAPQKDWMMNINDWNNYPLKNVDKQHFRQETVVLDGNKFTDCEFDHVTLVYNGQPFKFYGTSHVSEGTTLRTDNVRLLNHLILMGQLGMLDPSIHTKMTGGEVTFGAVGGDFNQQFNKDRPKKK